MTAARSANRLTAGWALLRIATAAGVWSLSSLLYFRIATWLGLSNPYNDAPILFSAYYAGWSLAVIVIFRRSYLAWAQSELPPRNLWPKILVATLCAAFAAWGVNRLPPVEWPDPSGPPDLLAATTFYFLPKSFEILFQQIIMTTMIVALYQRGLAIGRIAVVMAIMFGGFHLALVLNGKDAFYMLRYTVAATAFGAAVPWLQLRVRNGFVWSYGLHWGFYALDAALARVLAPGAPLA